jgi:phage terminase large subunit-like protein
VRAGKVAVEALLAANDNEAARLVSEMEEGEARRIWADWPSWAHAGQTEPEGAWLVWVMLAGRGFGKTRAGAEWVERFARETPGAAIALVAATADEARRVMVEGPSGLLSLPRLGEAPLWEPSRRRLEWENGTLAFVYSGANPEGFRGPEHHAAWCDELAKWRHPQESWDNLQLGLRCGERPRTVVTTTPRSIAALKAILGEEGAERSGGRTADNPFVSAAAVGALERRLGGTRLGRQELDGELFEDVEGSLWPRELIEACRVNSDSHFSRGGANEKTAARESDCHWRRVVVGVDPPAGPSTGSGDGDACGIVVCGLGADGVGYVLADLSASGLSPDGWARKVAAAAEAWRAQRVVAEANNGGRMVETVLKGAGLALPVRLVHASEGKSARAAPVAALFESKQAKFAGRFPALEDELTGLTWGGVYEGPGRSPDRADAMVWALTELLLERPVGEPRIRRL